MAPGKRYVKVVHRASGEVLVPSARWCEGALCRLVGLQFRRPLSEGEGLLLVMPQESVVKSSIHMFFVFFPIAAIWMDDQGQVTSAQLAKPWRPYYASPRPARYVLETAPEVLDSVREGDLIDFLQNPSGR
jgi:uncharacterized membrane protein (UPF0127 family)